MRILLASSAEMESVCVMVTVIITISVNPCFLQEL
jgi:hypothetical protein